MTPMTIPDQIQRDKKSLGGRPRRPRPPLGALAVMAALALAGWAAGPAPAWGQGAGLPPLPRSTPAAKAKPAVAAPAPAPAPQVPAPEVALLAPAPKDIARAEAPCSELEARAQEWMKESLAVLQAQMLRPNGAAKARDGFAELWLNFKLWRDKGYDVDGHGARVEALYKALYPAGAFAPENPFERFKEPRWACRKAKAG